MKNHDVSLSLFLPKKKEGMGEGGRKRGREVEREVDPLFILK